MKFLLDTCAISEYYKKTPNQGLGNLMQNLRDDDLYLSVITLGEIEKGILLVKDLQRQKDLEVWFMQIKTHYQTNILTISHHVVSIWANITAAAQKQGKTLAVADGLIAATAIHHDLSLITRNVKDFAMTPVIIQNPWSE